MINEKKLKALQEMAKEVFADGAMVTTDELLILKDRASSDEEFYFYVGIHSWLLGRKQQEYIKNVKY